MTKDTTHQTEAKHTIKPKDDTQNKMVSGSAWMTAGSMTSRLLGALYIIPWMAWMGNSQTADAANALFQIGYTPYAFFLSLATAGVPSAISKQVSYYNALGEYEISKNIYKKGLQIMAISGLVSSILLFVLAPFFAAGSPSASVADSTAVIRSLTPALLFIPLMSVTRGFIQGHNTMAPSAISQIIEQIARVSFMLVTVYLVRVVWGGSVVLAVAMSTFAAFIGALFASGYLGMKLKKQQTALRYTKEESANAIEISTNQLLKSIIKTAIPFIIIATGIILFQFVDQFTYQPIMERVSTMDGLEIQRTYGISQANAHKLIMIIISFGTAMAITSVPLVSDLIAKNDMKGVRRQFSTSVQLLFFLMFPAATGMAVLAGPLYTVFYGYNEFGTTITQVSAYMSIFLAGYALFGNSLQAANKTRPAIYALLIGLVTKIVLQYPFLAMFSTYGMLYTNMIGFGVTGFLMLRIMHKTIHFNIAYLVNRIILIAILSGIMGGATLLVREAMNLVISPERRLGAMITIIAVAVVGVATYVYLAVKTRLADRLIGTKAQSIRNKLHIK
ncbi:putative polysaccharide biosynthesis protein [Lacticigenium naphthae]|uniref:putative polysaccharide biosynthesis protein n=1 Tax=Lacticigenium naphthae TaxID=515351 RepID=UPI00041A2F0E|nr:polysaccharide biosynthesis protein [Lacticigenium naphthae]